MKKPILYGFAAGLVALGFLFGAGILQAQNVSNYTDQGGAITHIAGELEVESGGSIDVEAGGALKSAGVSVLPTYEDVTATNVLAVTECGKTMGLNSTTEFATTLPAATANCRFDFIVKSAPSGASYTIISPSGANIIFGQTVSAEDAAGSSDFETAGGDTVTIVDGKAVKGDTLSAFSDGAGWYFSGFTSVQDAVTFTSAT